MGLVGFRSEGLWGLPCDHNPASPPSDIWAQGPDLFSSSDAERLIPVIFATGTPPAARPRLARAYRLGTNILYMSRQDMHTVQGSFTRP